MIGIPFALESVPVDMAEAEIARLRAQRPNTVPVLLGDADVFSTEWAESVDDFAPPEEILAAAAEIDIDTWFEARLRHCEIPGRSTTRTLSRIARIFEGRVVSRDPDACAGAPGCDSVSRLRAQLDELTDAGEDAATLAEMRDVIAALELDEAEGKPPIFPDPIFYVCPRTGEHVAAALLKGSAPWEGAAWLQHGTYAFVAPKPVLVAHCRSVWERHGARIITASTDHIGFEVERPIVHAAEAKQVLDRFCLLGANEINADRRGTAGASLIGARRWWVWWD